MGVGQIIKAWRQTYHRYLAMDWRKLRWADPVCRFGLTARGVVFMMLGAFVFLAAIRYQPQQARGLGGALHSLLGHEYGRLLLAVLSLGLIAYAAYSMIEAVYRRIDRP